MNKITEYISDGKLSMFRAGEFQQAFGIEPRINYYYYPKGKFKMSMVSNDYKTMGMLFVKHDIRRFLITHGVEELDEGSMLSIAMDIFKGESSKEVESIKLYIAVMKNSNILIGNYSNNIAVKRAEIVGGLIAFVTKIYNLLVRLYANGLYTEYRELIAYINDVDVLCKNIPDNIDYDKLAETLSELYRNAVIEVGCERAVTALAQSSEEETEKVETN